MAEDKPNWWTTLPGLITGLATLITAIGGLIIILKSTDHPVQQQLPRSTTDNTSQQQPLQSATDHSLQQQSSQPTTGHFIQQPESGLTTTNYATVIAKDFVALKVAPDINAKRLLKINSHEVVQILSATPTCETIEGIYNCWYKIVYNGIEGYAFGGYLRLQN